MSSSRLEPGLLTIFRMFLVAQFFLMFVNLHVHAVYGFPEWKVRLGYLFVIGGTLGLLIYITTPWFEKQLGRLYLPIALVCSTVFSLVAHYSFLTTHTGASSEENAWQYLLFLCIPLLFVSWQYELKSVLTYCLFITFLDTLLVWQTRADFELNEFTYHRLTFIRFISFLFIGYVVVRIMRLLRAERQALQAANRKLETHLATLEQLTVSRERNRVARELHDTLAHTLSGVAVQLEAVDSLWTSDRPQAHSILQHSLQATRDGLTETRKAIQALRASPLEDLGLANAIREYAEVTAGRTGVRLELDLPKNVESLPPEVEQCFYRIGQEAIENTARHAQAKSLKVRLIRNASEMCMEIIDDGVGFDPRAVEAGRHFGLQGMRERAQLIRAELDVISRPGDGTRLSLLWRGERMQNGGDK
ncbi:MAG: sensor histidine kinase [Chloroflexota bacterium]